MRLCRRRLLGCYRLTFQGDVAADASSLAELVGWAHEFFLSWEHPTVEFLAYFHAAAVRRGGHIVPLPAVSGIGKSTLAADLAGHGFGYLGDDCVAMATTGWSLRRPAARGARGTVSPVATAIAEP